MKNNPFQQVKKLTAPPVSAIPHPFGDVAQAKNPFAYVSPISPKGLHLSTAASQQPLGKVADNDKAKVNPSLDRLIPT